MHVATMKLKDPDRLNRVTNVIENINTDKIPIDRSPLKIIHTTSTVVMLLPIMIFELRVS